MRKSAQVKQQQPLSLMAGGQLRLLQWARTARPLRLTGRPAVAYQVLETRAIATSVYWGASVQSKKSQQLALRCDLRYMAPTTETQLLCRRSSGPAPIIGILELDAETGEVL